MRRPDDAGAATVLALALCAVLVAVLLLASVIADLLAARQRAAAAADLGALAAAPAVLRGDLEACAAASLVVRENGAVLRSCEVVDLDVSVVVSVRPRGRWAELVERILGSVPEPTVRARAGLRSSSP